MEVFRAGMWQNQPGTLYFYASLELWDHITRLEVYPVLNGGLWKSIQSLLIKS